MMEDYRSALRAGQRAYRASVARGQSPYLAVLDEIIADADIVAQEPLGLVDIPAESIVGTKTAGRHTAFASNFMPLLWRTTPSLPSSGRTSVKPIWKRASIPPSLPSST